MPRASNRWTVGGMNFSSRPVHVTRKTFPLSCWATRLTWKLEPSRQQEPRAGAKARETYPTSKPARKRTSTWSRLFRPLPETPWRKKAKRTCIQSSRIKSRLRLTTRSRTAVLVRKGASRKCFQFEFRRDMSTILSRPEGPSKDLSRARVLC
ncbi:hypothetical protein RvY_05401-2 [Ramazzottius varieornatus]|uniref:Uncharacterized protein n=1 Tax=Ramazzottius varieornatus TaxID=947166 RepID=A0A1D1UUW0_RAMVA|nr:hypothetical protein RvY_05401-2 [Ramazzottius varieornatus]